MTVQRGLAESFDSVSAAYDKYRPGYVDELYRAIFAYAPVDAASRVLEIGPGSGQATQPILQTGCRLTAVECGERFSQRLREKFGGYPGFEVLTGKFEDVPLPPESFDLIFSATAFHWIPEKEGYEKVHALLKRGGTFARFANHPFRAQNDPALAEELDSLYAAYYDAYYKKERKIVSEYTEKQAGDTAQLAEKYGFSDVSYRLFYRERRFSAAEYVALLGTYSDHIAIEQTLRQEFFRKIEEAIRRRGNVITIRDTMDLQLARKR